MISKKSLNRSQIKALYLLKKAYLSLTAIINSQLPDNIYIREENLHFLITL